ncbi:MAG: helix-turn-helix transcriptional regulator [Ruminococcus sp.]|nr:helix-turn-helix transcriptional regulator [Ruminococcus sp.]
MAQKHDMTIGEKIRLCRKNCGLSQQQVANALGIDRTTVGGYESGRRQVKLTTITKLAHIFRVDVSDILPAESSEVPVKDDPDFSPSLKPIYSLTKDEQQLLISYRLLNPKGKKDILAKITKLNSKT